MRAVCIVLTLSACSFHVPGLGSDGEHDQVPVRPADDPGTSSVPPTADPPVFDPPAAILDGGSPAAPQSQSIGDACDKNLPCGGSLQCLTKTAFGTTIPGGYCSIGCGGSSPCPGGSQCSTQWGPLRICLETCPAAGCRTGYVCCSGNGYSAPGVCLPGFLCGGGGGGQGGGD